MSALREELAAIELAAQALQITLVRIIIIIYYSYSYSFSYFPNCFVRIFFYLFCANIS